MSAMSAACRSENSGTRADHSPRDDEIAAAHFVGKGRRDYGDRQGDHHQAEDNGEPGHEFPERRRRDHVAIATVHRVTIAHHMASGNRTEFVGLDVAFDQIHHRSKRQCRPHEDDQTAEQRAAFEYSAVNSERMAAE